jgi:hypothetical protein
MTLARAEFRQRQRAPNVLCSIYSDLMPSLLMSSTANRAVTYDPLFVQDCVRLQSLHFSALERSPSTLDSGEVRGSR